MQLFYLNYAVFDLIIKLNFNSSYQTPFINQCVFSVFDKNLKNLFELSPISVYSLLAFNNCFPKLTVIKHQSSGFKTRKNDLYGFKQTVNSNLAINFLPLCFLILGPEFSLIGLKLGFNVNSSGSFSISAGKLNSLPFFYDCEFSKSIFTMGFNASFSFNTKLTQEKTKIVLSTLSILTTNEI